MKISSKVAGIKIISNHPYYNLTFNSTNEVKEVSEEAGEKILRNKNFYEVKEKPKTTSEKTK